MVIIESENPKYTILYVNNNFIGTDNAYLCYGDIIANKYKIKEKYMCNTIKEGYHYIYEYEQIN